MLNVCYSPKYFAHTHTNSMEKLKAIADQLSLGDFVKFHEPADLDCNLLYEIHSEKYVNAVLTGEPTKLATIAGFKPWCEQLKNAVLSINAGQIRAAELAFEHGISANIAQGFHHATYDFGGSFCTFNGLALIAKAFPSKRVFILDCDQHMGDGTVELANRIDNLFNFSIYGFPLGVTANERSASHLIHKTSGNFAQYTMAIYEAFQRAIDWQADIIVYQAGMDCHQHDPFGSKWLTTELIEKREELVFSLAKKHKIPIMFVMAGGYQPLPELVPLHLKTFEIAHRVFYSAD